jgi:hypothetical protein
MAAYHADERGDLLSRYAHPDAVLIDAIDLIRLRERSDGRTTSVTTRHRGSGRPPSTYEE